MTHPIHLLRRKFPFGDISNASLFSFYEIEFAIKIIIDLLLISFIVQDKLLPRSQAKFKVAIRQLFDCTYLLFNIFSNVRKKVVEIDHYCLHRTFFNAIR
jgi:hypothetical protein